MKFTIITSLLAASGLASVVPLEAREATPAAAPTLETRQVTQSGDNVWKVSDFVGRKPEGTYWGLFSFKLNAGSGDSTFGMSCSASGVFGVQERRWYQCGENLSMWFAYENENNGLWIRQGEGGDAVQGTTDFPNVCRAGGSGPNDQVCNGVADRYVTLLHLPS
ncbi:Major allergen Alt a 1 [Curvularia clavata]|uniref:Major allergen Alt a 1 n=1 Tax=Curvularia clavata TaxID=95742 RepID=A0A9Q8ZB96_CURCL|nr:Major allergen Alt a 1 [Curvularia clavata]